jgi:hypothetical protein
MIGFRGLATPQQVELYNAMTPPHSGVISVGVDRVPVVDEVNSLPRLTADMKELQVIEVHGLCYLCCGSGYACPSLKPFGYIACSRYLFQGFRSRENCLLLRFTLEDPYDVSVLLDV